MYSSPMYSSPIYSHDSSIYRTGELSILAATASMWAHFPWVLYNSGPDAVLTPYGATAFANWMEWVEPGCANTTAFLGGRFQV
jgi:hypothetical protein